ncbi:MAG: hypothetical protein ACFBZ8_13630 [Opitutales bacterium]
MPKTAQTPKARRAAKAFPSPVALPASTTMRRADKARSGIYLGGIGSGGAELRKDGCFYNWGAFNNMPLGTGPLLPFDQGSILFFVVRYQVKGQCPKMKVLQIDEGYRVGNIPTQIYEFPWLDGVAAIDYAAS